MRCWQRFGTARRSDRGSLDPVGAAMRVSASAAIGAGPGVASLAELPPNMTPAEGKAHLSRLASTVAAGHQPGCPEPARCDRPRPCDPAHSVGHARRIATTPRPIVSGHSKELPGLGSPASRIEHRRCRRRRTVSPSPSASSSRSVTVQQEPGAAYPIGQGRAIQVDALASMNLRLPIQRKMIEPTPSSTYATVASVGSPPSTTTACRRCLHHHIGASGGRISPPPPAPELRRDDVQAPDVLADPMQNTGAAHGQIVLCTSTISSRCGGAPAALPRLFRRRAARTWRSARIVRRTQPGSTPQSARRLPARASTGRSSGRLSDRRPKRWRWNSRMMWRSPLARAFGDQHRFSKPVSSGKRVSLQNHPRKVNPIFINQLAILFVEQCYIFQPINVSPSVPPLHGAREPAASRGLRRHVTVPGSTQSQQGVPVRVANGTDRLPDVWTPAPRPVPSHRISFTRSEQCFTRKTKIVPLNGSVPIIAHQRCQAFHTLRESPPAASPQEPAPSLRRQSRHCLEGPAVSPAAFLRRCSTAPGLSPRTRDLDRHRRHDHRREAQIASCLHPRSTPPLSAPTKQLLWRQTVKCREPRA